MILNMKDYFFNGIPLIWYLIFQIRIIFIPDNLKRIVAFFGG